MSRTSAADYELTRPNDGGELVLTVNEVEVSRLRLARRNAGLTLEDMAQQTKLTVGYLSALEIRADKRRKASLAARTIITATLNAHLDGDSLPQDFFEAPS
jgi:transcriptional regulator with XRE-family HTH domain